MGPRESKVLCVGSGEMAIWKGASYASIRFIACMFKKKKRKKKYADNKSTCPQRERQEDVRLSEPAFVVSQYDGLQLMRDPDRK